MREQNNKNFDDIVSGAIRPENLSFDFNKWKQEHQKELAEFKAQTNNQQASKPVSFISWRKIMRSSITKLAAAAVIIAIAVFGIYLLEKSATPAYAIEQTIKAFENVQFMHIVRHDEAGQVRDERWIEIGPDGIQAKYRQDTPLNFFVVDNLENIFVYYKDKNTAVLYGPDGEKYCWIVNPREFLKEIAAGSGSIRIEENIDYWGKKVHHLRLLKLNMDCYIDPESKLPMAMGGYDISYENPPPKTFDIVIPEGAIVVDKRLGAKPVEEPEWMKKDTSAQSNFDNGRRALADSRYSEAVEFLMKTVELEHNRNWAWFWLGRANYESGQYDLAIYHYSKVIDMMGSQPYCYLARGLAYVKKGIENAAKEDISKALPTMIIALRHIEASVLFDLADDPLRCADGLLEGCHEGINKEQSIAMMVNRLRIISGQNFNYDPNGTVEQKEQAITACEEWYKNSGQIKVTFDANL